MNLEVPPSFQITPDWQPLSTELRHWFRPVWIKLHETPTGKRVKATIGTKEAALWRSRGVATKETYLHIVSGPIHILVNWTTQQIRTARAA